MPGPFLLPSNATFAFRPVTPGKAQARMARDLFYLTEAPCTRLLGLEAPKYTPSLLEIEVDLRVIVEEAQPATFLCQPDPLRGYLWGSLLLDRCPSATPAARCYGHHRGG